MPSSPQDVLAPPGRRAPLLSLHDVAKVFDGNLPALRGMSLDIAQGDFISLLGPSGCGKSTALRLIAGLIRPSAGRIIWHQPPQHGHLGVVFQEPTLMPWASVAQNVWLPLRLRGAGFAAMRDEIAQVLSLVGIAGFADAYPRELSGGMKMRVSIARALITRPRLILMDEPFAALDEITRNRLNNDLLALRDKIGCTIIFVTHSVIESVFLSERIIVMAARPGRVVQELRVDPRIPRDDAFRASPEYAALCGATSRALHDAMDTDAG
ncbi:MAG: ABC transporter ATP-binding protein [Paracoccus sp. (in: a-proteobacteria)]|nr:ABC transporter ATP-binding protein [Paracoccus sp. (in: a-proteobacteria)]